MRREDRRRCGRRSSTLLHVEVLDEPRAEWLGNLLSFAKCSDGVCGSVGQVGNGRQPAAGLVTRLPTLLLRPSSAGCQPARRMPSCPTTSAEYHCILRDSICWENL